MRSGASRDASPSGEGVKESSPPSFRTFGAATAVTESGQTTAENWFHPRGRGGCVLRSGASHSLPMGSHARRSGQTRMPPLAAGVVAGGEVRGGGRGSPRLAWSMTILVWGLLSGDSGFFRAASFQDGGQPRENSGDDVVFFFGGCSGVGWEREHEGGVLAGGPASHACRRGSGSTRGFNFFFGGFGGFFHTLGSGWHERVRGGGFNPLRGATTGVVMRRRATSGEMARGGLVFVFSLEVAPVSEGDFFTCSGVDGTRVKRFFKALCLRGGLFG